MADKAENAEAAAPAEGQPAPSPSSAAASAAEQQPVGGELVFCGSTDWAAIGRKGGGGSGSGSGKGSQKQQQQAEAEGAPLVQPHRLAGITGVSIAFVAAGSAACHCIALDTLGQCYTWGRNENGQLGLGDMNERRRPTLITTLKNIGPAVWASAGRNHSVVALKDGRSFSWGGNKHGQLGTGSLRIEVELNPVQAKGLEGVTAVACGADFTAWILGHPPPPSAAAAVPLASAAGGKSGAEKGAAAMPPNLYTAGLPQYGQLGHGTDNEYNAKESSVKLVYEPQPTPRAVQALAGKHIAKIACGNNHSVAVDSNGFLYTWGFGGHGRLGHKEQKDEWRPRRVDVFQRANLLPPTAVVAAGSSFSACTAGGGQLYMWGRVKPTGDNWMYPKPVLDLSGWNIRSMSSGNMSSCVAADNSCISWGTAYYGELGYGPNGPKSSANPKKVESLDEFYTLQVACGMGHTMMLLDRSRWAGMEKSAQAHIDKIPLYDPPEDKPASNKSGKKGAAGGNEAGEEAAKGKRKAPPSKGPDKKKRAGPAVGSGKAQEENGGADEEGGEREDDAEEDSQGSDEGASEDEDDDDEEYSKGKKDGRKSPAAKGRGASKSSSAKPKPPRGGRAAASATAAQSKKGAAAKKGRASPKPSPAKRPSRSKQ